MLVDQGESTTANNVGSVVTSIDVWTVTWVIWDERDERCPILPNSVPLIALAANLRRFYEVIMGPTVSRLQRRLCEIELSVRILKMVTAEYPPDATVDCVGLNLRQTETIRKQLFILQNLIKVCTNDDSYLVAFNNLILETLEQLTTAENQAHTFKKSLLISSTLMNGYVPSADHSANSANSTSIQTDDLAPPVDHLAISASSAPTLMDGHVPSVHHSATSAGSSLIPTDEPTSPVNHLALSANSAPIMMDGYVPSVDFLATSASSSVNLPNDPAPSAESSFTHLDICIISTGNLRPEGRTMGSVINNNHQPTTSCGHLERTLSGKSCYLCKGEHYVYQCSTLRATTAEQSINVCHANSQCTNCFSSHQFLEKCSSKHSCSVCRQRHHTLLHLEHTSGGEEPFVKPIDDNRDSQVQLVDSPVVRLSAPLSIDPWTMTNANPNLQSTIGNFVCDDDVHNIMLITAEAALHILLCISAHSPGDAISGTRYHSSADLSMNADFSPPLEANSLRMTILDVDDNTPAHLYSTFLLTNVHSIPHGTFDPWLYDRLKYPLCPITTTTMKPANEDNNNYY